MIVQTDDLYKYSIALRNSGITPENIDMLERQALLSILGKENARTLISYINENKAEIIEITGSNNSSVGFGGEPKVETITYTYGEITELIDGDNVLFSGLKALLAVIICMNLLSQNRIQVARQNVTKQPNSSHTTSKREEADVVQGLSYTAHTIIYAMDDYLMQEGKNPLNIRVLHAILPARYSTNTSGRMPQNTPYFMGFSMR